MKKRYIVIGILIAAGVLGPYAWYAHASIYWKLGAIALNAPSDYAAYTLGAKEPNSTTITYVALGDSLTAGVGVDSYTRSYPYLIASSLSGARHAQVRLEPFAVPGVRTQYVIDNFLDPAIALKPDVITLLIGVNDIHGKISDTVFKEHYDAILKRLTGETKAEIYVINLPYIGTPSLIDPVFREYFEWRTARYNAVIKELAAKYDVTYIDLYSAHQPHELDNTYYASDHFHPNAAGYTLWARAIYAGFNN